jgi:hypothetical protein
VKFSDAGQGASLGGLARSLPPAAKIAVARALHDGLRARELHGERRACSMTSCDEAVRSAQGQFQPPAFLLRALSYKRIAIECGGVVAAVNAKKS